MLQNKGFLVLDTDTGLYRPGLAWVMALMSMGGVGILARALGRDLRMLAEATGEGASFSIHTGDLRQIVNVIPASSGLARIIPVTGMWPLTETGNAHVHVHLAFSSEDTKKRAITVPAVRCTDRTVTDPETMRALLAKTAAEGIAYPCEERSEGRAAVAAPIFCRGNLVAALGLHLPPERFDQAISTATPRVLRTFASAMSGSLHKLPIKGHSREIRPVRKPLRKRRERA